MHSQTPKCGAIVRVRGTPATLVADLAGRIGEVVQDAEDNRALTASGNNAFGRTTQDEHILLVSFSDPDEKHWFAPSLLEVVHSADSPMATKQLAQANV